MINEGTVSFQNIIYLLKIRLLTHFIITEPTAKQATYPHKSRHL